MLAITAPFVRNTSYEYVADNTSSYMRKSVNWIIVRYGFNLSICGGTSAYHPEAVMPPAPRI